MNIGSVIRRLRYVKEWTLQRTCEEADYVIQPGHLSRVERGEQTPSIYAIAKIAEVLGTTVDDMLIEANGGQPARIRFSDPMQRIPLVSWVQAGAYAESPIAHTSDHFEHWVTPPKRIPDGCFALRVAGDSMQAPYGLSFPAGTIIIVDPNRIPDNRSLVIARLEGSSKATFKQLETDSEPAVLKPLNPQYRIIEIDESTIICGVVLFGIIEAGDSVQ